MGKTKDGKEQSVITKITLNDATFHGAEEEPTFINFHFGRNGVGKTTASKVIRHWAGLDKDEDLFPSGCKSAIEPAELDKSKYTVLVYDQDYIDHSFRKVKPGEAARPADIKAVYTSKSQKKAKKNGTQSGVAQDDATFIATEENVSIDDQIQEKKKERETVEASIAAAKTKIEELKTAGNEFAKKVAKDLWDNTEAVRKAFPESQEGLKRNNEQSQMGFLNMVKNTALPENDNEYSNYSLAVLTELHEKVYPKDGPKKPTPYRPLDKPEHLDHYKEIPGSEILEEEIKSTAESALTDLINDLKNSAWVKQGIQYAYNEKNKECKCPFCQRKLPEGFEKHLEAYFDNTYENKISSLKRFRDAYSAELERVYRELNALRDNSFPGVATSNLKSRLEYLRIAINSNVQKIDDKIKDPTKIVKLPSLDDILKDIEEIIDDLNKQIDENQKLIAHIGDERKRVNDGIWVYFAITYKGTIDSYKEGVKKFADDIEAQKKIITDNTPKLSQIDTQISKIRENGVDITEALNNINNLLVQSGFQGFRLALAPKMNPTDPATAYRVVREVIDEGGKKKEIPAVNLSEGERNFIAFLYFYYTVAGSIDIAGVDKAKIVVIDDPVSSMDGNAVFIVGSLIRNMIEVCHNHYTQLDNVVAGNYIHQIFIFTHNVYFHREVTIKQNDEKRTNHVAFYLYRKTANKSTIKLCVKRKDGQSGTELENYNPVQNSYTTLWSEYKELQTPMSVLNVIRQILDYYFIQLCGYDGPALDKLILEEHYDDFVTKDSEGHVINSDDYNLVQTMLRYLHVFPATMDDDQYYSEDEFSTDELKRVFELIFKSLKQDAHYDMMMRAIELNTDYEDHEDQSA